MEPSVFTRIIQGEIPCHKIYEDDKALVFLDIEPVSEGHLLVIPKEQIDHLWDVNDELYQHLMAVAKKAASRIREILNPQRVGMSVDGFDVPHAHIHLYPLMKSIRKTDKIPKPSDEELAAMAKRLAF